jgi:hypothetical protein
MRSRLRRTRRRNEPIAVTGHEFISEPSAWGAVRFLVLPRDLDLARQLLSDLDEFQKTPLELPDES